MVALSLLVSLAAGQCFTSFGLGTAGVGRHYDGRLEAFANDSNHNLQHNWQTSSGGSWTGYSPFYSLNSATAGIPSAVRNNQQGMEIAVKTTAGHVEFIGQSCSNCAWPQHPVEPTGQPTFAGNPVMIAAADGHLEVFIRGSDGALWLISQCGGGGWSCWSGLRSLGGQLVGDPSATLEADGRISVFIRGPDNAAHRLTQYSANGAFDPFWYSVGGGWTIWEDPQAFTNNDGRVEVYLSDDVSIRNQWETSPNGSWSGLNNMGFPVDPSCGANSYRITKDSDGTLELFASQWPWNCGGSDSMYRRVHNAQGWSGWLGFAQADGFPMTYAIGGTNKMVLFAFPASGPGQYFVTQSSPDTWPSGCHL